MKDHFKTLGIPEQSSDEEIKKAYKKLAMKHHPDRGGDQTKFQEIQEAYDVLTNTEKRMRWEQEKHFGESGDGRNFHFNFGFGPNIDDIIRQFHGGPGPFGFRPHPPKNRDLKLRIELDLVSTLEKQTHHVNIRHIDGSSKIVEVEIPRGVQSGMQMKYAGQGDVSNASLPPGDLFIEFNVRPHPDFQTNGINLLKKVTVNCLDAMLGGKIQVTGLDNSNFEVNVPPATQQGTRFRIPGHGLWDINHPTRGDLYLEVNLEVPNEPTEEQLSKLDKFRS